MARGRDIVARWCTLAEQRLEHLTELFETGRWRRYHSERAFLENIQEAKAAVEIWRNLLTREASLDNTAVDLSWLGRAQPALPRSDRLPRTGSTAAAAAGANCTAEPPSRDIPGDVLRRDGKRAGRLQRRLLRCLMRLRLDDRRHRSLDLAVMQNATRCCSNAL